MIVEFGHFALILSCMLAFMQILLPVWGVKRKQYSLISCGSAAVHCVTFTALIAFLCLTYAYATSDFSVLNVAQNSHTEKPLIYKLTGVWGNHEGSMLLWVLILAFFGSAMMALGDDVPTSTKAYINATMGLISFSFLLFLLLTSNPFTRLFPVPENGQDLNPLLQDIGLALHPPLLYLGYVGLSIAFAFAVAALIEGRMNAAWARWLRPWVLLAWMFLTAGISMGSYWAYYELGWGGWWFWDPVENASFMPWLAATALLHSAAVMDKREALKVWTILLAIIAFSLSLLGTFIVRSGVLTSVHSFAIDPERGVAILLILFILVGGAFALFLWRAPTLKQGGVFSPISREGALVFNNIFLSASLVAVFVGTLYPLALEVATNTRISVGPPYYNITFGLLTAPLLMIIPFGGLMAWKKADLWAVCQRLTFAFLAALVGVILFAFYQGETKAAPLAGIAVAIWLIIGSFAESFLRANFGKVPLMQALKRWVLLPRTLWGSTLAHCGVGILLLGIIMSTSYQLETITTMEEGETVNLGHYAITLDNVYAKTENNYRDVLLEMSIREGGRLIAEVTPSKRFYFVRNMPTTEVALETRGFSQIYITPGELAQNNQKAIVMRLYYKPLIMLIWIGTLFMIAGAVLSLSDRRLRMVRKKG